MVENSFSALAALSMLTGIPQIGAPMQADSPYRQRKADLKKHQAIARRERRKRAFKHNLGNQFCGVH